MKKLYFLLLLLTSINIKAQTYAWTKTFGGNNVDNGYSIATGPFDNVIVGGTYGFDSIDVDPSSGTHFLPIGDGDNIFFAKYDASGNLIWANSIVSDDVEELYKVVVDNAGNVYITGFFYGSVDFDPSSGVTLLNASAGYSAAYLAKYDANGNYLWAQAFDGIDNDRGHALAFDAVGNICIAGVFRDTVDFDPSASTANLISADTEWDIFFAKYTPSGNYIWAKRVGGIGFDYATLLHVDVSDNVYIGGIFATTADFDPSGAINNLTASSGSDIYFAKYDAAGNYIWAKMISSSMSYESLYGITTDDSNNIYLCGHFAYSTDFNPSGPSINLTPSGPSDLFLAKYNTSGNCTYAKKIGGIGEDHAYDIKVDSTNTIYLTGSFKNTVDFDPGTGAANATATGSSSDLFIAKYTSSAGYIWSKTAGGSGDDLGRAIAVNHTGDIYFTGWFNNTVDFNPSGGVDSYTSNGGQDIFITKYSNPTTAVESTQKENLNSIKIYPNPVNNTLFCETDQNTQIYIYNSSGALVLSQQFNAGKHSLDVSFLVPGVYLVRSGLEQKGLVLVKQ